MSTARILSQTVYKVLYNFEANNEVELSCRAGEIVVSAAQPQDNWLMVYKYNNRSAQGFVPFAYLEEMNDNEPSSQNANPISKNAPTASLTSTNTIQQPNRNYRMSFSPQDKIPTSSTVANTFGNRSTIATSTNQIFNQNNNSTVYGSMKMSPQQSMTKPPLNSSKSAPFLSPIGDTKTKPSSLLFEDNTSKVDSMFNQMMKQRNDLYKKFEERVSQVGKEVLLFQDKNEQLIERIKQFDQMLEAEKQKQY